MRWHRGIDVIPQMRWHRGIDVQLLFCLTDGQLVNGSWSEVLISGAGSFWGLDQFHVFTWTPGALTFLHLLILLRFQQQLHCKPA